MRCWWRPRSRPPFRRRPAPAARRSWRGCWRRGAASGTSWRCRTFPTPTPSRAAWPTARSPARFDIEADLVYDGQISHPENRALVNLLDIPIREYEPGRVDAGQLLGGGLRRQPGGDDAPHRAAEGGGGAHAGRGGPPRPATTCWTPSSATCGRWARRPPSSPSTCHSGALLRAGAGERAARAAGDGADARAAQRDRRLRARAAAGVPRGGVPEPLHGRGPAGEGAVRAEVARHACG